MQEWMRAEASRWAQPIRRRRPSCHLRRQAGQTLCMTFHLSCSRWAGAASGAKGKGAPISSTSSPTSHSGKCLASRVARSSIQLHMTPSRTHWEFKDPRPLWTLEHRQDRAHRISSCRHLLPAPWPSRALTNDELRMTEILPLLRSLFSVGHLILRCQPTLSSGTDHPH